MDITQQINGWDINIGIPITGFAGLKNIKWISPDSLENFNKNKPKGWTKDSIDYTFNSHGYRSVEFVRKSQRGNAFTIASYGCSSTLGIGVSVDQTWPEIFKTKMETRLDRPVINFNFGQSDASMDFVTRVLYNSLPVIKPDLVLILLPSVYRCEQYDDNGEALKIIPDDIAYEKYYEHIANEYEIKNNFLKNLAFIETILKVQDIKYIFMGWSKAERMLIKGHQDVSIKEYRWYDKNDDKARDEIHFNVVSYTRLANLFMDKYNQLYT